MSSTVEKSQLKEVWSAEAKVRNVITLQTLTNNKTSGLKEAAIIFRLASRDSVSASPLL